ncbi:Alpha/Beta hydrolase protein [Cladochytrium replicatum]|nr:Alpha/Beta hydrolase protein [Cladochytrium replicatum]
MTRFLVQGSRKIAFSTVGRLNRPEQVWVYFHGFPSCRLESAVLNHEAEKYNALLLAIDRPGYGQSDTIPDHTIANFVSQDVPNVLELIAREGTDISAATTTIIGVSGGGPYAASAILNWCRPQTRPSSIPPITRAVLVAAMPPGIFQPQYLGKMPWLTRFSYGLLRDMPRSWLRATCLWQRDLLIPLAKDYLSPTGDKRQVLAKLKWLALPADIHAFSVPTKDGDDGLEIFFRMCIEAYRQEETFAQTYEQSAQLYFNDPGFSLKDVGEVVREAGVEVTIFQGGKDVQIVSAMGKLWSEHLGGAYNFYPDDGHISLFLNRVGEIGSASVGK